MGKNIGRQNPKIHLEGGHPGCMYTILNALHHNNWSNVKKMLPYKRLGGSSRHNANKSSLFGQMFNGQPFHFRILILNLQRFLCLYHCVFNTFGFLNVYGIKYDTKR